MKKMNVIIAGAAAMMALPAFAAINPLDPGLPQAWTTTAANSGYAAQFIVGSAAVAADRLTQQNSFASAFCVECHNLNPSAMIDVPDNGGDGYAPAPATDQGSHTVANAVASTNSGGGWANAFAGIRVAGQYEKVTAWAPGGIAGKGFSKYGDPTPAQTRTSQLLAGDMICESCHNILVNRGDQLLLGGYDNEGATVAVNADSKTGDQLCVACHATGGGGGETYESFHDNGNMRPFWSANPIRKRHHVLNDTAAGGTQVDDTLTLINYHDPVNGADANDSVMWAPSYTRELSLAPGGLVPIGAVFAYNKGVSATGQGISALAPLAAGDIDTLNTQIMCVSCHRPHNAMSNGGAFILRTGDATNYTNSVIGGVPATTPLMRQQDKDPTYTVKVYGEYLPLCQGCHTGYN